LPRPNARSLIPLAKEDAVSYGIYKTGIEVLQPWYTDEDVTATVLHLNECGKTSLVSIERMLSIKWAFHQTAGYEGEVWEAGVYQGGTAALLARLIRRIQPRYKQALRLFDSFEGLPKELEGVDLHHEGEFADTSLDAVKSLVGNDDFISYHPGWLPGTLAPYASRRIRLAHIDLDLYRSTLETMAFVYPRVVAGGIIVIDDYGFVTCPGALKAVDEFLGDKPEKPLVMQSGQAIIVKVL
jgi:O-methyltransferase